MSVAYVVCYIYILSLFSDETIEANNVDPRQTAPLGKLIRLGLNCLSKRHLKRNARTKKVNNFVVVCAFKAKDIQG